MFKLGHYVAGECVEHSHPPIYALEPSAGAGEKVVATAPGSDWIVFQTLAQVLNPPFFLLYVLHTPRGEGDAGRYQSPELSLGEVDRFLSQFGCFLRSDARFDLWAHSIEDDATIIWDRHNLIHGYGATSRFVEALRALGFDKGEPGIPAPHAHHYHQANDEAAKAVLDCMNWHYVPLRPEDEQ